MAMRKNERAGGFALLQRFSTITVFLFVISSPMQNAFFAYIGTNDGLGGKTGP
jgi:hypothetical protein